jgi:hypothetical protein
MPRIRFHRLDRAVRKIEDAALLPKHRYGGKRVNDAGAVVGDSSNGAFVAT